MANFWWNKPVHQSSTCISQPAVEPVSLAQAKLQCRIDDDITQDDALLTGMITAARIVCENYIKRAFITQTWLHNLDDFPFWRNWTTVGNPVTLMKPPVQSVVSLVYLDQAGNSNTFDPSLYTLDNISEPARIIRNLAQPWPLTGFYPNAVQITAVHGYGDCPNDVPLPARQAILMHVTWQYRNRGDQDSQTDPPAAIWALLDSISFGGTW